MTEYSTTIDIPVAEGWTLPDVDVRVEVEKVGDRQRVCGVWVKLWSTYHGRFGVPWIDRDDGPVASVIWDAVEADFAKLPELEGAA